MVRLIRHYNYYPALNSGNTTVQEIENLSEFYACFFHNGIGYVMMNQVVCPPYLSSVFVSDNHLA